MSKSYRKSLVGGVLVPLLLLCGCQLLQQNQVSVDYYKISGTTTAALDREIKRKGPKINGGLHAVAVARIKMFPKVTYEKIGDRCHVDTAKVTVDAKVTLPKWTSRAESSKQLGEAWDNIDRYTRLHEATHVNMAFSYAKRMEDSILALPPMKTCKKLRARTKRLVDRYLKEHDAAQRKYDRDEQQRFAELARQQKAAKSF